MKINKYGCRKSGDVCLVHCQPLLGDNFCEECEAVRFFKKTIATTELDEKQKRTITDLIMRHPRFLNK